MAGSGHRRWMAAAISAAVGGVVVWGVLRFGLLTWLGDEKHSARPVIEGLSWAAGIGGLLVGVAALVVAVRQGRREVTGVPEGEVSQSAADRGVIINHVSGGSGSGPTVGVNFGHVIGAPPVVTPMERADAPPGLINLPHRSAVFLGRGSEMRALHDAVRAQGAERAVAVAVIHGLGGVGKSALVTHYAHIHRDEYELVWWIAADSPAEIRIGLARLAIALQPALSIMTIDEQAEHAVRWLASHSQWLLVLDNVDDPRDIDELAGRLPKGRLVITSRRTTGWQAAATVSLNVLRPTESAELLLTIINGDNGSTSTTDAERLCAELGHLPLAISQAAAYMTQTGVTPAGYLELLADHPAEMYQATGESRDATSTPTMARVWQITLDRLSDTPLSGNALRMLAWCASEGIPFGVLSGLGSVPEVRTAAGRLAAYAMISLREDVIEVHRLVQAVTRTPDPADVHRQAADIDSARRRATTAMVRALGDGDIRDPETWPQYRSMLAHVEALTRHSTGDQDTDDTVSLLTDAGVFLGLQGQHDEAVRYLQRCLDRAERLHGRNHQATLTARNNLASAYQNAGNLDRAVELFESAVTRSRKPWRRTTADGLRHRNNLAGAHQAVGDFAKAIPLYESVLRGFERKLGPTHKDTLACRNNLASAYQGAGDVQRAIPLFETLHEDFEQVLGPRHVSTLTARNNLANAYRVAGDLDRAVPLHESTHADRADALGAEHPDTLQSMINLANAYVAAGDVKRAIPLLERALSSLEQLVGPRHPSTLVARNSLASAYQKAGKLKRAIPLLKTTLADRESTLGAQHPSTLISRNNLASAYHASGDLRRAILLYKTVLAECEELLGPEHPLTATVRGNLSHAQLRRN